MAGCDHCPVRYIIKGTCLVLPVDPLYQVDRNHYSTCKTVSEPPPEKYQTKSVLGKLINLFQNILAKFGIPPQLQCQWENDGALCHLCGHYLG